ncbi:MULTISPECIES: metal-binding protein [Limnospira]|nr:metal-binding protein [Arthrospira platensis]KDR55268.1 hypothetical protein APPUASWS_023100 [Arthrospira platensis str. Paraca]MBD2670609.1 metal-binding protein [Arthrospira platensis FACHB-439]MBD2711288.1 metal-binding protein [Arthrospira platensis FACHB-835]MDF2207365.1 metal-binding protein [Arthrospira platensis NCB002]MDT9183149.1 metal-binding protein [Limnospira sp. PMC 289.06]MDT9296064.1 metal-binding protein [Arthrospira platensis PCC 7345]MDT9310851.1 metal-binding protein 
MPSGKTHDRITLWSLPLVAGLTFGQTRSSHLTLLVSASFLFSGLMFGPDLDLNSRQFQRWGWFRWLWVPYQKSLHHRSFLSHGPFIGTALRVLYLFTWLGGFGVITTMAIEFLFSVEWTISSLAGELWQFLVNHSLEWIAIFCGLELGAMSHYLSDWGSSIYKRLQSQGVYGLIPPSVLVKKPKNTTSRRSRSNSSSTSPKSSSTSPKKSSRRSRNSSTVGNSRKR